MAQTRIPLAAIRTDPDLQMRVAGVDVGLVTEYADAILEGASLPAILLYHDGHAYWPADGFHRIEASRKAGQDSILAEIREGSKRDAMLEAVGANANHGLRRTNADKRRSVLTMLRDPEWSGLSDREIGKRCAVDHKTVGAIRRELTGGEIPAPAAASPARGEIPNTERPATTGGSMVAQLLAKATTEALISECRRRGLEVTHAT